MTHYYTSALDGNNAYDGLAPLWTGVSGPKLTITAGEALLAAGDTLHIRPGAYRELWTWGASGGNAYQVGTVNVINGSAVVTGVGTLWLANCAADYMFHNTLFASGADGVTNGTATFTSAAGNFQAAMVGQIIQINTRGAYKIDAVGGLNTITLSDPNGLGWPGAAVGLSYSVMSGMEPFDVLSVDGNTQLTLTAPWNGPTLTGLAYITYNPIRAIGDVTGQIWGVGGTVRITGSDDDISTTRNYCVTTVAASYRVMRGFSLDLSISNLFYLSNGAAYITVEDCTFQHPGAHCLSINGAAQLAITVRRCDIHCFSGGSTRFGILFSHTSAVNNAAHLVSNCKIIGPTTANSGCVNSVRVGGCTIRNSVLLYGTAAARVTTSSTLGQALNLNNNLVQNCTVGFNAAVLGDIVENYNAIFGCLTNYTNTAVGVNSNSDPAIFSLPTLFAGQAGISGFRLPPPLLGELSQWSQVKALAGFGEAPADILGLKRPGTSAKNSWGAVQYQNQLRDTATVRSGAASLKFTDAGRQQMFVPVSAISTTFSVYVYREANYTGTNPQMIIKQPGQADIIVTDAGAVSGWNLLTTTFVPNANPGWVVVELVSNNTAAAGSYAVYFDDLLVS